MRPSASRFLRSVTEARNDPDHPASQWAQRLDYAKRLHDSKPGYVLGRYRNPLRGGEPVYHYDYSDGFIGLYYPTRSGKGVSFVIPNGLSWAHSLFFNDPKVEIIKMIGGHRRYNMTNMTFCVAPASRAPYVSKYNFLDEVRLRTFYEISDAYNIATAIVDPDGKGFADAKEAIWKRRSRDLLTAAILHILYCPEFKEKTLATLIEYFTDASTPFEKKLEYMREFPHDVDGIYGWKDVFGNPLRTHPFIRSKLTEQIERTEQEAASVKGEAQSYLSYYQNFTVRENCSRSDFSMRDLMDNEFPSTVSLGITPDELEAAQPFLRLFLNLFINRNLTEIAPDPVTMQMKDAHYWKMGMLLDEFALFGRLDLFVKQLAFLAGYGFKPAMVTQDLRQIQAEYSTLETLTANTSIMMFGRMNTQDSAEYFSKSMGDMTMGMLDHSKSVNVGVNAGASYSTNQKLQGRPFLRPEEIRRFSQGHSIKITAGGNPVVLEKLKYYEDDSRYAHLISNYTDEVTDSIPYDHQIARINLREQQKEYLDWCQRNGEAVTERTAQLERNAEKVTEHIRDLRDKYIGQARTQNRFAIPSSVIDERVGSAA